jgi:ribosomal protein S18 acetylase RimI-like enzyme
MDDYDQVLMLKQQVHSLHVTACPEFYKDLDKAFSKEKFVEDLNNDRLDIYVLVKEDHGLLGYAYVNKIIISNHPVITNQKVFFIEDFCIDEKYRGKGFGKELFKRLEESARTEGFTSIELDVWDFNETAKNFYEKTGMECIRHRMRKTL